MFSVIFTSLILFSAFPITAVQASLVHNITYLGSTSGDGAFVGSGLSLQVPANTLPGDFLIAVVGVNGNNHPSWMMPAGWSKGQSSNEKNSQGIYWWWKFASNRDAGSQVLIKSTSWQDGGANILAFRGVSTINPFASISPFKSDNNDGNGDITSVSTNATSWALQEPVISLILASWQDNAANLSVPNGYTFIAGADDGFSYQASLLQNTPPVETTSLPSQTIGYSTPQAVVSTIQIALEAQ